jgi:hypothetical protein
VVLLTILRSRLFVDSYITLIPLERVSKAAPITSVSILKAFNAWKPYLSSLLVNPFRSDPPIESKYVNVISKHLLDVVY